MNNTLHEKAVSLSKQYHSLEAELLDVLEKIKDQKIYLALGFDSLFSYCVKSLNLSESKAWSFSALLKKTKLVPEIKEEIKTGGLTLSKASRIVSVLTPENKADWIEKAKNLPKQELEKEVAKVNPESTHRSKAHVVSDKEVRLHLNISHEEYENLKKMQILISKKRKKNISLEETISEMTEICIEKLDPVKKAERASHLAKGKIFKAKISNGAITVSTAIRKPLSAALKHQLNLRDQGKCQFKSRISNLKCNGTALTEFHHLKPVARGGNNELSNLMTLCSKHHSYQHEKLN